MYREVALRPCGRGMQAWSQESVAGYMERAESGEEAERECMVKVATLEDMRLIPSAPSALEGV